MLIGAQFVSRESLSSEFGIVFCVKKSQYLKKCILKLISERKKKNKNHKDKEFIKTKKLLKKNKKIKIN